MSKILFHINSMGKGGAERVVSVLSRYFAEDGCEVLVTTQWQEREEYPLSDKVRRISVGLTAKDERRSRVYKAWKRLWNYRRCIRREKPDLVISFCAKANFRSVYALLGSRIPLLVSVRNDPKKDYAPYARDCAWMEKRASGCVFQTRQAQEFFTEKLQKKSRVIENPLSERYLPKDWQYGDILPIPAIGREKTIVTVGRITKQKNQLVLVKAFASLAERFPEYRLLIYGEDSGDGSKEAIEHFCREKGIAERVVFCGLCSHLESAIEHAGVFVLSSDYEGLPNALAEAMALGLPVVSTDCPCGGPAQMIEQGESGILVEVNNEVQMTEAIEKVLTDKNYAAELGSHARHIAERMHPQKIYQEWKEYANLLTASGRR